MRVGKWLKRAILGASHNRRPAPTKVCEQPAARDRPAGPANVAPCELSKWSIKTGSAKVLVNTAKTPFWKCGNSQSISEDVAMIEPKLEVPAELRDLAEKTIDQAEKAFGMFFEAANKSMASIPNPGTEISKQALSFTEQNMKAAFEHARKLVHATDLQEAMRIQSEFLKSQFTNAGEHMRQITGGVMSAGKDASKGKF
jgi:phasin